MPSSHTSGMEICMFYTTTVNYVSLTHWRFWIWFSSTFCICKNHLISERSKDRGSSPLSPEKAVQLQLESEQHTGSKLGLEYLGAVIVTVLFKVYAEYITQNPRLHESQAGMKTAGRNINNLRYADDTTLMAESKEKLKSLLMSLKEQREKAGLKDNIQKLKSRHLVPSLHGK